MIDAVSLYKGLIRLFVLLRLKWYGKLLRTKILEGYCV